MHLSVREVYLASPEIASNEAGRDPSSLKNTASWRFPFPRPAHLATGGV